MSLLRLVLLLALLLKAPSIQQFRSVQSEIARNALSKSLVEGRVLLSCEWESLKRKCETLQDDAITGKLLDQLCPEDLNAKDDYFSWVLKTEVCGKAKNAGRSAVQATLTRFQRMVMQLDRSDGIATSVDPGEIAQRYVDMINTCMRTEGAAWTAALSGIEYAGLNLSSFIDCSEAGDKAIDVAKLSTEAAARLLDCGKQELQWDSIGSCSALQCQDMMACIFQVLARKAILNDQLLSKDESVSARTISFRLKIHAMKKASSTGSLLCCIPHESVIETLLINDLGFEFDKISTGDRATFAVPEHVINEWAVKHSLQ